MKINQIDFSGGMSALLDITKTAPNAYRLGVNCRIRKNGIEPAFRHVRRNSPTGLHQAVFSNDARLALIVNGQILRVDLDDDVTVPVAGMSGTLSSTADVIYHQGIPAPTSWLVNNNYQPTVSTFSAAIVLQDDIHQPVLLFPDFAYRAAQTYNEWTYDNPEYIPIGSFMAYSGRKLFIAKGSKIYQSVSGRAVDFVLNINSAGDKRGDANTTHLAVAAPQLSALVPSQTGGLVPFTRTGAYSLEPVFELPLIFGEPQYLPGDLFPVGAVNHLGFTMINGESVFISPAGIQAFNQVMQTQRASNLSPYGAKIIDYIVRPITWAATATVDDYTFIALETIFGPAILVHDNVLSAYVGFDLTLGIVKEFATIEDDGMTRLFYITATGLYEIPLYTGSRATAAVYFGEYSSGSADVKLQITDAHLGFNRVAATGEISAELWVDKVLRPDMRQSKTLTYTGEDISLLEAVPQRMPLGTEMESTGLSFDFSESSNGYASGLFVTIGADARLVSLTVNAEGKEFMSATPQIAPNSMNEIYFYGQMTPDEILTGATQYEVTAGRKYVLYSSSGTETVLNANEQVTARAGVAVVFTANADIIRTSATALIYDYHTFVDVLVKSKDTILLPRLGNVDVPAPLAALTANAGLTPWAVLGSYELFDAARAKAFYQAYTSYSQMRVEYDNANVFLFSDVTANLNPSGPAMSWLAGQIQAFGVDKFNICCFARAPYTATGTPATDLRWPFDELGVKLVITGNTVAGYERVFTNGVTYISNAAASYSAMPGGLGLVISANSLQGSFADGKDQFTILR